MPGSEPKARRPPGEKKCFRPAGQYKQMVWLGFNILKNIMRLFTKLKLGPN
jgi:hypothetical protein